MSLQEKHHSDLEEDSVEEAEQFGESAAREGEQDVGSGAAEHDETKKTHPVFQHRRGSTAVPDYASDQR